ncbi:hypothetical protein HEQ62_10120 [Haematospirillum jordaniae]|uniref:BRO-N domain-containing protein n=1 Tax=Haematospirillum jordaniae TaxID=1549855 RepID=UPI001432B32A|nr:Bro-N domain-containing protein [Haematospirillum jordaniae]NKD46164.1 hypothetical protein [Haematospirillum jordaniae]NKD60125.1 hypothetical protein [Haematospirillum jordaniae]NKD82298.1 hypothetical protein [Haematospirillum jordaniae]NKD84367.1 hypothetical protein [Haematospirillum jordaniae]NKD86090.1 hypothetical protein [Haematospirillum jordaniae]
MHSNNATPESNAMTMIPFVFEGDNVRTIVDENGVPWFVAADVCRVLEISKYRDAIARLDEDERRPVIVDTLGGPQEMTTINESGLYSLILTSRKPTAKRFKRWVTGEVLPSIRMTGCYHIDAEPERPDVSVANMDRSELRTLIALVSECRSTWGRPAAQYIWNKVPLPQVDDIVRAVEASAGETSVAAFLRETVVEAVGSRIQASAFYRLYKTWCDKNGHSAVTMTAFGREVVTRGLHKVRMGTVWYHDIAVSGV